VDPSDNALHHEKVAEMLRLYLANGQRLHVGSWFEVQLTDSGKTLERRKSSISWDIKSGGA
jgi:hypothetical protein